MKRFITVAAVIALATAGVFQNAAQAEVTDQQFQQLLEKYLGTEKGQELVGSTVEKYFRSRQEDARKQQEAKAAAEMENQFKNPVKIEVGGSPVKGKADARITIVEFSDFQCPYCKRGMDTMDEVLKAYPNDVKLAFKNLPLPFHKEAMPSAQAALAAGKQGKFWEMHDALFNNQRALGKDFYAKKAGELGLNVDQFKKDMEDAGIKKQIESDMEVAKANGISGTPGFFVNGVAVRGAYPFEHFKELIDRLIKDNAATAKS